MCLDNIYSNERILIRNNIGGFSSVIEGKGIGGKCNSGYSPLCQYFIRYQDTRLKIFLKIWNNNITYLSQYLILCLYLCTDSDIASTVYSHWLDKISLEVTYFIIRLPFYFEFCFIHRIFQKNVTAPYYRRYAARSCSKNVIRKSGMGIQWYPSWNDISANQGIAYHTWIVS